MKCLTAQDIQEGRELRAGIEGAVSNKDHFDQEMAEYQTWLNHHAKQLIETAQECLELRAVMETADKVLSLNLGRVLQDWDLLAEVIRVARVGRSRRWTND